MSNDPIIEEIHAIREALSKASGDDIRKIAEAAQKRQAQSGVKAVELPPRRGRATAIGLRRTSAEPDKALPPAEPTGRAARRSGRS